MPHFSCHLYSSTWQSVMWRKILIITDSWMAFNFMCIFTDIFKPVYFQGQIDVQLLLCSNLIETFAFLWSRMNLCDDTEFLAPKRMFLVPVWEAPIFLMIYKHYCHGSNEWLPQLEAIVLLNISNCIEYCCQNRHEGVIQMEMNRKETIYTNSPSNSVSSKKKRNK